MNHKIILDYTNLLIEHDEKINNDKAVDIWNNYVQSEIEKKKLNYTINELKSFKKKELEELCKENGINPTGTKTTVINRLMNPSVFDDVRDVDLIKLYLDLLKEIFPLDEIECLELWENRVKKSDRRLKSKKNPESVRDTRVYTVEQLKKLKKSKLIELCLESRELDPSCPELTKEDKKSKDSLVDYLIKAESELLSGDLHKQIRDRCPNLQIQRNKYGNYEHPQSGYIFDEITHYVIGKQKGNKVEQLYAEDIPILNELQFKYKLPINLSSC